MKEILFGVVVLSLGILIIGCSQKKSNLENASVNGIFYAGNGNEPQDLDPSVVTGVSEQRIVSALFEGLVSENPQTLQPEPATAESWDISKDALTYTFKLRKNAKWSDGIPVTAQDFVYAYNRILSSKLGSQNAYMLYCMKNAEGFNKGTIADFKDVGVKAINDHELQITLERPTPYFLPLIAHMSWFPLQKKNIEKFGAMDQRGTKWTLPGNLVGNGSFILKDWKVNKVIKVVKNPHYWDAGNVKLNEIDFFPISDNQAEERTFRGGQLHMTFTVPTSKIDYYKKNASDVIKISPYLGTYYIAFNVQKPPFDNVLVRKAFSLAIDRKSIAEDVMKGGKIPADSFTPPNTAGYTSLTKLVYDVQLARKCLADAGYPDGKGFPRVEIMCTKLDIAEALQDMIQKNLNIKISLVNKEWKMYLDSFRTRDFYVATASWIGDYNDPLTFLGMWTSDSGNNRARWLNKDYDKLMAESSICINHNSRFEIFKKAETLLMEQAPIIPLCYCTSMALLAPQLKGWYPNVLDHHPYKYMSLEKTL